VLTSADPALRSSYLRHYLVTGHLIEIASETGEESDVRELASDFAAHRDVWDNEILFAHGIDLSLYFERLALPVGQPLPATFEVRRKAWVEQALFAGADRGEAWSYAYAGAALTPADAQAALDALAQLGPPSPTPVVLFDMSGRNGSPEAYLGRVYLLAGRIDQAIDHLQRAVASCDIFTSTLDHVRAVLDLGRALEQKGELMAACEAYGTVLARWGHAKPRSVTADAARARSKALACPG
jgi:serine/threonine-protein kinase